MSPLPLVSIVMPSYDRPFLLKGRSIPSVLRQSYPHWELIVVGDGPEDDAIERAVTSFGDPRMRYTSIERPDYAGLSNVQLWHVAGAAARNHALDLARGDVVCPLDDDDEFLPNHLEDCVRAIVDRGLDVVYGSVLLKDIEAGTERLESLPVATAGRRRMPFDDSIYHSTVGFSRRFRHLRYPVDGAEPDDFGLWKQMFLLGAQFGRLTRPQSVSYGESLQTRHRTSRPTVPDAAALLPNVEAVLEGGTLSEPGAFCERFEDGLATRIGAPVVAVGSHAAAWLAAFTAVRISSAGARRDVVVPGYASESLVEAVRWAGFEPVFCDVDPDTLCATRKLVEPLLTSAVAAIVAIEAHGAACDMTGFEALAHERGITLVGDATAGFTTRADGRHAGNHGDLEIVGLGDRDLFTAGGGAVVCARNAALYEQLRTLVRRHDPSRLLITPLDELRSALGLASLGAFDAAAEGRRRAADRYTRAFESVDGLRVPRLRAPQRDYPVVFDSPAAADKTVRRLASCRVDTTRGLAMLPFVPHLSGWRRGDVTHIRRLLDRIVCLPLYDTIRDNVVDLVSGVVLEELDRATTRPRLRAHEAAS